MIAYIFIIFKGTGRTLLWSRHRFFSSVPTQAVLVLQSLYTEWPTLVWLLLIVKTTFQLISGRQSLYKKLSFHQHLKTINKHLTFSLVDKKVFVTPDHEVFHSQKKSWKKKKLCTAVFYTRVLVAVANINTWNVWIYNSTK